MFMKNKRAREQVKHGKQDIVLSRIETATISIAEAQKSYYKIPFYRFFFVRFHPS